MAFASCLAVITRMVVKALTVSADQTKSVYRDLNVSKSHTGSH